MELLSSIALEDYKHYSVVYFETKKVERNVLIMGRPYTSIFKRSFTDDRESLELMVFEGCTAVVDIDIYSRHRVIHHCTYKQTVEFEISKEMIEVLTGGFGWTSTCAQRLLECFDQMK
jgi:hypothetical protein